MGIFTADPTQAELHNCEVKSGKVMVREGWRLIATGLGTVLYGFTIESGNTTEVWHYVVSRDSTTGTGTITVYLENFGATSLGGSATALYSVSLGQIPEVCPVYVARQNQQLIINSPGFNFAIYGIIGGGLAAATATSSVNPDTTALTIPTGIICEFGDRFCIAQGSILYFNDPGTDPRTFTAENEIPLPSTVYHLEQTDDGFLVAFCAESVWVVPRDALGQGQFVLGSLARVPGYQAADYRCAASSNGVTACLVRDGVAVLQQDLALMPLQAYHHKRRFTDYVAQEDFRYGQVHKTANGFLVSYPLHSLVVDVKNNFRAWYYDQANNISIAAVLNTRDGRDLYLTTTGSAYQPIGTFDDVDTVVDGYCAGELLTEPSQSQLLREIHTSSDNPGKAQFAYLRGAARGSSTATPSGTALVIGTDQWSASGTLFDRELRSVRHQFDVRTDFPSYEVGTRGNGRQVGLVSVITKPSGANRPNQ